MMGLLLKRYIKSNSLLKSLSIAFLCCNARSSKLYIPGNPLQEVRLAGNPWNCDCTMEEYYNWTKTQEYQSIESFDSLTCEQPRKLRSYSLALLDTSDLTCDFGICSPECVCSGASELYEPGLRFVPTKYQRKTKSDADTKFPSISERHANSLDELRLPMPQVRGYSTDSSINAVCTGSKLQSVPPVPDTTEYLVVAQNAITSIRGGDLTYLRNLKAFIASDNQLSVIEMNSFLGLHSLSTLYLNKNNLSTAVPKNWFANLTALQDLRLDDNTITGISDFAFSDLEQLSVLDLSVNHITSLKNNSFIGLQSLQYLNLASNGISIIEEHTFHALPNLSYLYLNKNHLSQLPAWMIQPNLNLEYLDISNNELSTIKKNFLVSNSLELLKMEGGYNPTVKNGSFGGLPNLKILRLGSSSVSVLEDDAFINDASGQASDRLQTLDLGSNSFTDIPLQALSKLNSLETLSFSENSLSLLPVWKANGAILPNLKTLYLAKNDLIDDIPEDSFVSLLSNLTALVMNGCGMTRIPTLALTSTNLQYLVVDENPITRIGDELSSLFQLQQFQFSEAYALEFLSQGAFQNLSNLERLVLSDSKLQSIPDQSFKNLKNLEVFDISNNQLSQPKQEWFSALDNTKVKSINLFGNPWVCDCEVRDYKEWIDSGANGLDEYFVSVTCESPQMYKSWQISEVNVTDQECYTTKTEEATTTASTSTALTQTPSEDCQQCYHNGTTKTVNCTNQLLQSVPRECFPSDVVKLELSGNLITEIKSGDFANLHNLRILDLSSNRITVMEDEAFSDLYNLDELDLSFNRLSEVPSKILSTIGTSLVTLNLSYQQISRVTENAFHLPDLTELSLTAVRGGGALPVTIEDFAFAKLPRLKKLNLSENAITSIGVNSFTGLRELTYLSLSKTGLSSFPHEPMWRLPSLTDLNLNNNSISRLGSSSVPILMSLEKLSMRWNGLTDITDDCFLNDCAAVVELDFGFSLLTKVPSKLLQSSKPKLEVIKLDHSQISTIARGNFPKTTRGFVDISFSKLQSLNSRAFADMKNLRRLNVASSEVIYIAEDAFANSGLKNLDISYNDLDYISCAWFDNLPYGQNITVNLSGNKFNCTCGMVGYRDYMESSNYTAKVFTTTGDICASPEKFNGTEIGNVPLDEMISYCEIENVTPSYCSAAPTNTDTFTTTKTFIQYTTSQASRRFANPTLLFWIAMILKLML